MRCCPRPSDPEIARRELLAVGDDPHLARSASEAALPVAVTVSVCEADLFDAHREAHARRPGPGPRRRSASWRRAAVYQVAGLQLELHRLRRRQVVVDRDRELDFVAARQRGGEAHVGEEVLEDLDAALPAAELAVAPSCASVETRHW